MRIPIYGLHTEYKVDKDNAYLLGWDIRPCFGAFLHNLKLQKPINAKVTIRLYPLDDERYRDVGDRNNALLVDKEGIQRQLNRMLEFYYFEYSITEYDKGPSCSRRFEVSISATLYQMQWQLLLTLFRQLYEYPYNICHYLIDTWEREGKLEGLSYVSAFNMLAQTFDCDLLSVGTEDGLTYQIHFSLPISNEELKSRIANCIAVGASKCLNTLFNFVQNEGHPLLPDYNYHCYSDLYVNILNNNDISVEYLKQYYKVPLTTVPKLFYDFSKDKKIVAIQDDSPKNVYKRITSNDFHYRFGSGSNIRDFELLESKDFQNFVYEAFLYNKNLLMNYHEED